MVNADNIIYLKVKKICLLKGFIENVNFLVFFLNLVHLKHKRARIERITLKMVYFNILLLACKELIQVHVITDLPISPCFCALV